MSRTTKNRRYKKLEQVQQCLMLAKTGNRCQLPARTGMGVCRHHTNKINNDYLALEILVLHRQRHTVPADKFNHIKQQLEQRIGGKIAVHQDPNKTPVANEENNKLTNALLIRSSKRPPNNPR